MLNRGYLRKPAKSAGFVGKHDKDYHIDQSLYIHIVNGVFAIARLLEYIARTSPFQLSEEDFRTVIAIFTLHDIHKDPAASRGSKKEFDVNLDTFWAEGEALAGCHATARSCASRLGRPTPCTLNSKRRPSGRRGCSWATFAHNVSKSRLRAWSLNGLSSTSTLSVPQCIRPGNWKKICKRCQPA